MKKQKKEDWKHPVIKEQERIKKYPKNWKEFQKAVSWESVRRRRKLWKKQV